MSKELLKFLVTHGEHVYDHMETRVTVEDRGDTFYVEANTKHYSFNGHMNFGICVESFDITDESQISWLKVRVIDELLRYTNRINTLAKVSDKCKVWDDELWYSGEDLER